MDHRFDESYPFVYIGHVCTYTSYCLLFFNILQNKILFSFYNFDFGFFIVWTA